MNFRSLSIVLLTAFAVVVWAQTPTAITQPQSGLSTEMKGAFSAQAERPFEYTPVDADFWGKIAVLISQKNWTEIIVEGARRADKFGDTPEGREGQLALTTGLRGRGFAHAAFLNLASLIKAQSASGIGQAALNELALLTLEHDIDKLELDSLLNSMEFGPLHPRIQSFVSMHRYLYNLRFGFGRWAGAERAQIVPGSVWDWELRYWQAVGDVARNRLEKAESEFQAVRTAPEASTKARTLATLQLARIHFERAQFVEAHALYTAVGDLGVREKGRILLEIAWTKYYLKNYDKALGMLMALRAPYFLPSLTPERFILESVIYRDLCHYEAVDSTVAQFKRSFHESLLAIRKRQPLREDRTIVNLALLDRDLQERANLIDSIRREREEFSEYGWNEFKFYKPTMAAYTRADRRLQRELDLVLEPRAREIAEQILDSEEQMQFLDYTSKLDALRIVRAGEDRAYKSQEITHLSFESIFWPVGNEFWWDEFDDYKTLISSRCGLVVSPEESKMEREFE